MKGEGDEIARREIHPNFCFFCLELWFVWIDWVNGWAKIPK
jgi:hypothetical protein